jgi:hypothetical protein
MYATIRRYTPKTGTFDQKSLNELKQRIVDNFVPAIQDIRGFHGYHVVNVGNRELVSFSLFEDQTGTAESNRRSADFVKKDPIKDQLGSPVVVEGELLVSKEALVGAR